MNEVPAAAFPRLWLKGGFPDGGILSKRDSRAAHPKTETVLWK